MPVDEAYRKQAALLIKAVPLVAAETAFALKGGTAINLFLRDMPRLSVDIDPPYTYPSRIANPRSRRSMRHCIASRNKSRAGFPAPV